MILSELSKDPKRAWIGQPQAAAEYANGTRFFAYRALRRTLSCRATWKSPQRGCERPRPMFRPRKGPLAFARAVEAELISELARRCKATPPQTRARALGANAPRFEDYRAEALP